MTPDTERQYDYRLVADLIEREGARHMTWSQLAERARVGRTTLHRIRQGDPRTAPNTMSRVESALSLPFGTFASVGMHDFDVLAELGVEQGIIEWLRRQATTSSATAAPGTSRSPSSRGTGRGTVKGRSPR